MRRSLVLAASCLVFALGIFALLFGQNLTVAFEAMPASEAEPEPHRIQQFWRLDSYLGFTKWAEIALACSVLVCSITVYLVRRNKRSLRFVAFLFTVSAIVFLFSMMQYSDKIPPLHLHRFTDSSENRLDGRTAFSFVRFPEVESTLALLGLGFYLLFVGVGMIRLRRGFPQHDKIFRLRYLVLGAASSFFAMAVVQWFTIQEVEISYFVKDLKTSASPLELEWSQKRSHWIWPYAAGGLVGIATLIAMRVAKPFSMLGAREWLLVVSAGLTIAAFPLDVSLDHQVNELEDRGDHWYHSGTMKVTLTKWPPALLFGYVFFFSWLNTSLLVDTFNRSVFRATFRSGILSLKFSRFARTSNSPVERSPMPKSKDQAP